MATNNSDLGALQNSPNIGTRAEGIDASASLRFITATYTMLGTEAAADKIRIGKLPPNVRVDPSHSTVVSDGVATTCTLDVGDDDDTGVGAVADQDRYADGLDVAAAGVDRFDSIACAARLTPYTTSKESWCLATFATLATPVAGKKLVFRIGYQTEV